MSSKLFAYSLPLLLCLSAFADTSMIKGDGSKRFMLLDNVTLELGDKPMPAKAEPKKEPAAQEVAKLHIQKSDATEEQKQVSPFGAPLPAVVDSAEKQSYKETIRRYSKLFNVDEELVYAIIEVESGFDKNSASIHNAYGLMQVKMDTAVSDVYKLVYGKSELPSVEFVYEPKNNIEIGVAYLGLIVNRFFRDIKDAKTKEYCTIAAYNAGAGTVLRTFHEDKQKAAEIINKKSPDAVLQALLSKMDSDAGRRYILKVINAKNVFAKNTTPVAKPLKADELSYLSGFSFGLKN